MESRALLNSLIAFKDRLVNSRVDIHVDNGVNDDGCKSSAINEVVKRDFPLQMEPNFQYPDLLRASHRNKMQLLNPHGDVLTWTVCCSIRCGCSWNALSAPIRSISCPWILITRDMEVGILYLTIRLGLPPDLGG